MKVFLDTNGLVSAVATRGLCADVVRQVLAYHTLIVSPVLLWELERVLQKKLKIPMNLATEYVAFLKTAAVVSTGLEHANLDVQEQPDRETLSSALAGCAYAFITGDQELLNLKRIGSMEILSPRMFWEQLRNANSHPSTALRIALEIPD